jgi:hypothetical protein
MKSDLRESCLSAIFVDYDNIYLSLKRKSEEAAKRFSKDAASWIKEIETGRLISATNAPVLATKRRIVMNRCYGNPVPRRNQSDNSTDMSSFPFVRHHFLRAGFEIVDCPPLTAQMKNSSDIRMVMDIRDYLTHETYFDEFVILSGDADFTPVLHRLRAHARRTVIFANDFTAAPYTALSDGEVRESDLVNLLLEGRLPGQSDGSQPIAITASMQTEIVRKEIVADVVANVRAASGAPVPLEVLADRAIRALGHERTAGSNWAGAGSFRELLLQALPGDVRLTEQPPYLAYEYRRVPTQSAPIEIREDRAALTVQSAPAPERAAIERAALPAPAVPLPAATQHGAPAQHAPTPSPAPRHATHEALPSAPSRAPLAAAASSAQSAPASRATAPALSAGPSQPAAAHAAPAQSSAPTARAAEGASLLQQSIARIHEACQAPPLSPPEYRALFDVMAAEITEKGLQGGQTLSAIVSRSKQLGLDIRRDDVRFVLEVVSEADPWFEQGASAPLFAGRFRNFVVARCRSQGLNLSADELDLIEAWFSGGGERQALQPSRGAPLAPPSAPVGQHHQPQVAPSAAQAYARAAQQPLPPQPASGPAAAPDARGERWWSEDGRQTAETPPGRAYAGIEPGLGQYQPGASEYQQAGDELPRIVRTRLRN